MDPSQSVYTCVMRPSRFVFSLLSSTTLLTSASSASDQSLPNTTPHYLCSSVDPPFLSLHLLSLPSILHLSVTLSHAFSSLL